MKVLICCGAGAQGAGSECLAAHSLFGGFLDTHTHTHTHARARCPSCEPTANHALPAQVIDWFAERKMNVYSVSCGSALLYNNIFPKHKERLNKRMSELVRGQLECLSS
eukprot:1141666-Pelagomonas_calceolata.AAC.3